MEGKGKDRGVNVVKVACYVVNSDWYEWMREWMA